MKRILSMMAGTLVLLAVSCSPYKYEFHLNKTAKEALERYCKLPIQK